MSADERLDELAEALIRIAQLQLQQLEVMREMRDEHAEDMAAIAAAIRQASGVREVARHPRPRRGRRCHLRLVE